MSNNQRYTITADQLKAIYNSTDHKSKMEHYLPMEEILKNNRQAFLEQEIENAKQSLCPNSAYFAGSTYVGQADASDYNWYIVIELPNANREWTFKAWDLAKQIVNNNPDFYPVHNSDQEAKDAIKQSNPDWTANLPLLVIKCPFFN